MGNRRSSLVNFKSAWIFAGAVAATALGIYWWMSSREPSAEELYRQYMALSPFAKFDCRDSLLKKAAEEGYVPAILQMAKDNFTDKKDFKSQEHDFWIKKAADMGNPQGQLEAFYVLDIPATESFDYLQKAARQSYGPALLRLGCIYAAGDEDYHIVRNEQKALELFRRAADANMPDALYLLYLIERFHIFSLTEKEKKADLYQRYLAAAAQADESPYPPFRDIRELDVNQCRRVSDFLQDYMGRYEKTESLLKEVTKIV